MMSMLKMAGAFSSQVRQATSPVTATVRRESRVHR
jgi:hypothetical protein